MTDSQCPWGEGQVHQQLERKPFSAAEQVGALEPDPDLSSGSASHRFD